MTSRSTIASKTRLRRKQALVFIAAFCLLGGYVIARYVFATNGPSTTSSRWLMVSNLLSQLDSTDSASAHWFFNTPAAFSKGGAVSGFSAAPIAGYTSYAQFSQDINSGKFPAGYKWVMYDNESWSQTPLTEAQHPSVYMKDFADLAHQHGLMVYEVPARDLMNVAGSDCHAQPGQSTDQAYIACQIPTDARYADIYSIQAQADQPDVTAYADFVQSAANQARAAAPSIVIMSGLTTDRGDSSQQIFACWQASHQFVSGYWMNSTGPTLQVAAAALDLVRAADTQPTPTASTPTPPTPTQTTPTPATPPPSSTPSPSSAHPISPSSGQGGPTVTGDQGLGQGSQVNVDGQNFSSNGQLNSNYLTNGYHTITVTNPATGQTTSETIYVHNKLSPFDTLRNYLFAGFKGHPLIMNAATITLLVVAATVAFISVKLVIHWRSNRTSVSQGVGRG